MQSGSNAVSIGSDRRGRAIGRGRAGGSGGERRSLGTELLKLKAMAGAWCATCCSPSVLPAVATCKRAVKSSSSSAHSSSALRRQSCLGAPSSSRRAEVIRCCCASTSRSESSCSDSGSHFVTRRQILLLAPGVAVTAAALPSYADEVPSLLP